MAGLGQSEEPRRILEVGPGTGSFTREIIALLGPEDELHLCEANTEFLAFLKRRIENDPELSNRKNQISYYTCPIQNLEGDDRYHHIISGLPFNNFPAEVVEEILNRYREHLLPGGTLRFFEYLAIRQTKIPFVSRDERHRLRRISVVLGDLCRRYAIRKTVVWFNLPPAIAWCLVFDDGNQKQHRVS